MSPGEASAVGELQRQVERGSLFTHGALGESYLRLGELQAFVHGLADTLLERGLLAEGELAAAIQRARAELQLRGELSGAGVMLRLDDRAAAVSAPVEVDCRARMHICKAACCRLDFALSVAEIEAGNAKWDLGRPYFVRHTANGCCVHNDPHSGGCGIYANRPGVCRRYSCAGDTRIWKDFERMVLNSEWIQEHLPAQESARAVRVLMHEAPPLPGKEA